MFPLLPCGLEKVDERVWSGIDSTSAADTRRAGVDFSASLSPGDVVALQGELGSGKTTFIQGVVSGLGLDSEVTSPTFALVHEYGQPAEVVHIDCYRETSLERWISLGVTDYFDGAAVCLVEWPEVLSPILPPGTIQLRFTLGSDQQRRRIRREN